MFMKLSNRTRYCNTVVIIVILIYYCPRMIIVCICTLLLCTLLYAFNYYLITSENIKLRIVF